MATERSIVILTGAGVSAESGVDTFRDRNGLWSKVDFRAVATPEGFAADPQRVHAFYNARRRGLAGVEPNAAHLALARLEAAWQGPFLLVTQNIDDLHERAGSERLVHMHGRLAAMLCANCGERRDWRGDMGVETPCPACRSVGFVRPDVVWFGEMPHHMERIYAALNAADLFVSIGTSGAVYPAAQFVQEAGRAGAHTVELNLEPSEGVGDFAEAIHGPAGSVVPRFVEDLIADGR